ncbi:Hypothetical protein PBC10988_17710 [Planctomycetales bacterium 10988]|nr:Hypothetical protein PBC10988_17710 [Planctomycetales bacterium 10988]
MTLFSGLTKSKERQYQSRLSDHRDTTLQLEQLEARTLLAADPLVIDLNPEGESPFPRFFTEVNDLIYFSGRKERFLQGVWSTDGTSEGTNLVAEIPSREIGSLEEMNGDLYFLTYSSNISSHLWKTDGTTSETTKIEGIRADSRPPIDYVLPHGWEQPDYQRLHNINGSLFFLADDGIHGRELWKSNGTSGGTELVKDINPGGAHSEPVHFMNVNGALFFIANSDELWKSDGTSEGTVFVTDIGSDVFQNEFLYLTVDEEIFFTINGRLWKSDGTEAGTFKLTKSFQGNFSSLTEVNGTIYFTGYRNLHDSIELWRINDSKDGIIGIKKFTDWTLANPDNLTNVNGTLFFSADTDTSDGRGVWKSDGTSAGTVLVKAVDLPLVDIHMDYDPQFVNLNGTLHFVASNMFTNTSGPILWQSDGTSEGTVPVYDNEGFLILQPNGLTEVDGSLLFNATIYGSQPDPELWISDGTSSGTFLVKDIISGPRNTSPSYLTDLNGTLFFSAGTSLGRELWKSDGTIEGTELVKDIIAGPHGSVPKEFININGTLYFTANDGMHGVELWKSDGTSSGTVLVKDIFEGDGNSYPTHLTNVNGTLYFIAENEESAVELWKSDGTSGGTTFVQDLQVTDYSVEILQMLGVDDKLYFVKHVRSYPSDPFNEVWVSDGTESGTSLLHQTVSEGYWRNFETFMLTGLNGNLLFFASDQHVDYELWSTDGTAAGTNLIKDINPYGGSTNVGRLRYELTYEMVNNTLFFSADDGTDTGFDLWKTDGTSSGTSLVKEITGSVDGLTNVNGTLFFSVVKEDVSAELWISDGTSQGTQLVKSSFLTLLNDSYYQRKPSIAVFENRMYFYARATVDEPVGLWVTDGTSSGTQVVESEIVGGFEELVLVDGKLFDVDQYPAYNYELWVLDLTVPTLAISPDGETSHEDSILFTFQFSEEVIGFEAEDIQIDGGMAGMFTVIDGDTYTLEVLPTEDGEVTVSVASAAAMDLGGNTNVEASASILSDRFDEMPLIATGMDAGSPAMVQVFSMSGSEVMSFYPFTESFTGGVRVATGDINGDGILDIVTAAGPGGGPHVQVFDSQTGELIEGGLNNFYAYDPLFTGGVFVAVGDVNDDGFDDIITSADAGGGPHVKVFNGLSGEVFTEFYAYDPNFLGGVRIAAGDIDNDGKAEIITGAGAGGGPHVRVFEGMTGEQLTGPVTNFYAYAPDILTGIYVASGDVNNDGFADIITSPGAGGGPHIMVFSSLDGSILHNFYAYDPDFLGGVRVGSADLNQDGFAEILTTPATSDGLQPKAFDGIDRSDLAGFLADESGHFITGGISLIPIEDPIAMSSFYVSEEETPSEDPHFESVSKKKSWFDDTETFYQSSEKIDRLFSRLGIWSR